jgi:hypothetical protein
MAWCFGKALDKAGQQLALSPEGNGHYLMLSTYFVSKAPLLPRWEFWPSKQGEASDGMALEIGEVSLQFSEVMVALQPNEERQMPNLLLYHANFAELPEEVRMRFTFIALDEVLGELGTDAWLAGIEAQTEPLPESFPLPMLAERISEFYELIEWEQPGAGPGWTVLQFQNPDPSNPFPQADSFALVTCCEALARDYFGNEENFADPMLEFGAAYVYLRVPRMWFAQEGDEMEQRETVTDALEAALAEDLGCYVGRGFSEEWLYISFLITDGQRSIDCLLQAAAGLHLPRESELRFFDQGKRGEIHAVT